MKSHVLNALKTVNGLVWGLPTLLLILGVGVLLSLRTGFAQVALFPAALRSFGRKLTGKDRTADGVSPFQALCTALAATVGTGNLAGVAGAITLGGPGAIFWMWVCAFFGMVTKYAEVVLALRHRVRERDGYAGGPMYLIRQGLGEKWRPMAAAYAFFGVFAAFGVGNATQINAFVSGVNDVQTYFGLPVTDRGNLFLGAVVAMLVWLLLRGGAGRIGRTAEKLVPFAACFYLLLGLGALIVRANRIPDALRLILQGAFAPKAVTGGFVGSMVTAIGVGASRGVFTNEAGMGTASIAHASALVDHPAEQGLLGIMEVFLDTIVICTMTALVILTSPEALPYGTDPGVRLTTRAFADVYGDWICIPIALSLCCFAFATVLGWGLYGARCAQYLLGKPVWKSFAFVQATVSLLGAILGTGLVWTLSETVNGLMAIPNLLALALLSPEVRALTKEYQCRLRSAGGTYEHIHQRQSLRTLAHAEISPAGRQGPGAGHPHPSFEHRSAGPSDPSGLF